MIDGQKTLIDACIDERVERYIASDYSLDFRRLELGQHPQKDPMKHVQAYLEQKEGEGKIKAVHILVGGLMSIMLGPALGAFPDTNTCQFWGTGDELLDITTYEDTAAYVAEVAADSTAVGFVNGEENDPLLSVGS
jgi:hypothetical protein